MALSAKEQSIVDFGKRTGQTSLGSVAGISSASLARINAELARQNAPKDTLSSTSNTVTLNTAPSTASVVLQPSATPSADTLPITTGMLADKPATVEPVTEAPPPPPRRTTNRTSRSEPQTSREDTIINEIQRTYQSELKRLPQQEGLDYWTNQVVQGNLTLAQAKDAIANSEEAKLTKELESTYNKYLDRDADEGGLQYFKDQVTQGNLTVDNAKKVIATSEEAKTTNPTQYATTQIYITNLNRMPDEEGLNYWDDQLKNEIEKTGDAQQALNNVGQNIINAESKRLKEEVANEFTKKVEEKDPTALGTILYDLKKNGQRVDPRELEDLFGSEAEGGYENSAVAYAVAKGFEAIDEAKARGDTATVQQLEQELQNPEQFFNTYRGTDLVPEDTWRELRGELLTKNEFYGRSDPKDEGFFEQVADDIIGLDDSGGIVGSAKAFVENPIEALDRWKTYPSAQILASLIPGGNAALSAINTLDSGESLSGMQVAALALAGADYMSAPTGVEATAAMEDAFVSSGGTDTSAIADTLRSVGNTINDLSGGTQGLINKAIDASGVRETVGAAGQYFDDAALQGLLSGTASATIEQVAGGDPVMAFLQELKGTSIDLLPESTKNLLEGYGQPVAELYRNYIEPLTDPDFRISGTGQPFADFYRYIDQYIPKTNLNLEGMLGDGINFNLPQYTGPDLNDINYDSLNNLSNINIPDINVDLPKIPNIEIPTYTGPDLNDINYDSLNNLSNIDLDFTGVEFPKVTVTTPDLPDSPDLPNAPELPDLPNIALPNLVGLPELLGPGEGASGLQKALPYDLDFLQDDNSLALAILQGRVG